MAFSVPATFFNNFNIYKNVKYNLEILEELYAAYNQEEYDRKRYLLKPIIVTEVSIIEVFLYDFMGRVRGNTREGVSGLDEDIAQIIRESDFKRSQFGVLISLAEDNDLFDEPESSFYLRLRELSYLRNRVHIQNVLQNKPAMENFAFVERRKLSAERCLEKVAVTLSEKYPRPNYIQTYLAEPLQFPWEKHLE